MDILIEEKIINKFMEIAKENNMSCVELLNNIVDEYLG